MKACTNLIQRSKVFLFFIFKSAKWIIEPKGASDYQTEGATLSIWNLEIFSNVKLSVTDLHDISDWCFRPSKLLFITVQGQAIQISY